MNSDPQSSPFDQAARPGQPPNPVAKLFALLLGAAFLVLAFMFSLVALAVVAVLGLALGGWLWWKTRALRKQMQQAAESRRTADMAGGGNDIIDGECIREAGPNDRLLR